MSTDTKQVEQVEGAALPEVGLPAGRGVEARKAKVAKAEAEAAKPKRVIVVAGDRFEWPGDFTGRELQGIQQDTGIRAGELDEAVASGDIAALLSLVVIAMRRAGREDVVLDDLMDLQVGAEDGIDFEEEVPTDAADVAASDEPAAEDQPAKRKAGGGASGRRRTAGSTD